MKKFTRNNSLPLEIKSLILAGIIAIISVTTYSILTQEFYFLIILDLGILLFTTFEIVKVNNKIVRTISMKETDVYIKYKAKQNIIQWKDIEIFKSKLGIILSHKDHTIEIYKTEWDNFDELYDEVIKFGKAENLEEKPLGLFDSICNAILIWI